MFGPREKTKMIAPERALRGRDPEMPVADRHTALGTPLKGWATSYEEMLKLFWENHDPTQSMRQGNDVGTQYRSAVYWDTDEHRELAEASRDTFDARLSEKGYPEITTEIAQAGPLHYAEDYHQQYLDKNPMGSCGLGGTGVSCPIGTGVPAQTDVVAPTAS